MRLILLTLPSAAEPVPLDACFEAGLQTLHVRKPDWTRPQLRAYLQTVAPQYRRRLVLHSFHELSAEFDVGVSSASSELSQLRYRIAAQLSRRDSCCAHNVTLRCTRLPENAAQRTMSLLPRR